MLMSSPGCQLGPVAVALSVRLSVRLSHGDRVAVNQKWSLRAQLTSNRILSPQLMRQCAVSSISLIPLCSVQWRFYVGARGGHRPPNLAQPPKLILNNWAQ